MIDGLKEYEILASPVEDCEHGVPFNDLTVVEIDDTRTPRTRDVGPLPMRDSRGQVIMYHLFWDPMSLRWVASEPDGMARQ